MSVIEYTGYTPSIDEIGGKSKVGYSSSIKMKLELTIYETSVKWKLTTTDISSGNNNPYVHLYLVIGSTTVLNKYYTDKTDEFPRKKGLSKGGTVTGVNGKTGVKVTFELRPNIDKQYDTGTNGAYTYSKTFKATATQYYHINFYKNSTINKTNRISQEKIKKGEKIGNCAPNSSKAEQKNNYNFSKWQAQIDNKNTDYSEELIANTDMDFIPIYVAKESTLRFYTDELKTNKIATLKVQYYTQTNNTLIDNKYFPKKAGYEFLGWYGIEEKILDTDEEAEHRIYDEKGNFDQTSQLWDKNAQCVRSLSKPLDLYPKWKVLNITHVNLGNDWVLSNIYVNISENETPNWVPAIMYTYDGDWRQSGI